MLNKMTSLTLVRPAEFTRASGRQGTRVPTSLFLLIKLIRL